ncbi:DUF418 domain-containing protein [Pseudoxanthomonas dokdonensis]|uniref:Membrane protein n=1 Tax=Pseudoxanthomonas dokdonensis TaxID=344882 RepID=A0A0R0CFT9_9GAMM|nr:DUF418 domain-containing protein [Pseudoxanthomonas dokdonensis]KRG67894.1 membrane protein [Pseudoxanthomonas dokdonensis]
MQQTSIAPLAPVTSGQRLQSLDVLRGFALLGILLMNIEAFVGPIAASFSGVDPVLSGKDRWMDALIYVLVQGKFFTLFSLLFGMGFAVMAQRAAAARRPLAGLYWRRSLVLLGIGLLHGLLLWSGDILLTYALLSLLLLAFADASTRTLLVVAVLSLLAPIAMMMALGLVGSLLQANPASAAQWQQLMAEQAGTVPALIEAQRLAYGSGSYAQANLQRVHDVVVSLSGLTFTGPLVFGMFLLGAWFVRSGVIANPAAHRLLFSRLRWLALPAGLGLMLASLWLQPTADYSRLDLASALAFSLSTAAGVLMCLGYTAWLLRGLQQPWLAHRFAWLAPAGRMALTNYLLQSLVCTLIFNGYGLGYYEQLPRFWQPLLVLLLFAVQVVVSRLWLQAFRFGPMEWLWRCLTYLAWQPLRRAGHIIPAKNA